jgi:hypothetical protein
MFMNALMRCCATLFLAAMPLWAQAVINEVRVDQTGTDNDEYFELYGTPGTDLSTLTYIVLGDSTGGLSGVIETVVSLAGQTIPASGYFVCAETTFTIGVATFTAALNFENTDTVTHMLVSGFTGANAQDLDTNDDGILDVTPWTAIVDRIAILYTGGELPYGPPNIGPEPPSFAPGHVFRSPDGSANVLTAWSIGIFDPATGNDTPGAPNASDTMSETLGGPQSLVVNAGAAAAGFVYVVVFGVSGTAPGIPLTPTIIVPLNFDPILQLSLDQANGPTFSNTLGVLDANGQAFATLNVPAVPGTAGVVINGAAVILDLGAQPYLASNPVSVTLTP